MEYSIMLFVIMGFGFLAMAIYEYFNDEDN